jgi:hypothetical protein
MKTDIGFPSYLVPFFLEWKTFQTEVVEKLETQILCSVTSPPPPPKSYRLLDNVEKML